MFEYNKLLGFHIHYICFQSWGPFFTVVHTTVYCAKLYYLTVKKVIIWYKFLLLLDRVFSELIGTNFNPILLKGIEVVLKCFSICTLMMLVGALLKQSKLLTHYSGG